MDKLDQQFEQLMKGIKIDSPSKGFSMKVMERIQAETAVQKKSILEDYQPVISKRTWILMIAGFIALIVYVIYFGNNTAPAQDNAVMSVLAESVQKLQTSKVSNVWQTANGLFASIPSVAYLIILASLALWTLDMFLTKMKHSNSHLQIN
ncbi:MAG: hypothetical protein ACM3O8_12580 [Methylococcaceae bacterium]